MSLVLLSIFLVDPKRLDLNVFDKSKVNGAWVIHQLSTYNSLQYRDLQISRMDCLHRWVPFIHN